jgi:hypothetical protein
MLFFVCDKTDIRTFRGFFRGGLNSPPALRSKSIDPLEKTIEMTDYVCLHKKPPAISVNSHFFLPGSFIHTSLHKKPAGPLSIRERDINCQARLFMSGIVRRGEPLFI